MKEIHINQVLAFSLQNCCHLNDNSSLSNFNTLLLRKEKPTISVTEWANASRQELNNIERTRSDRQEAQKRRAREIFCHILRE